MRRRYMHGKRRSPFRNDPSLKEKKKDIGDDIGFDEQYNIFYDKDIQRSYEQRRGRFAPPKEKLNIKNPNRLV